jgi:hypothetical protein
MPLFQKHYKKTNGKLFPLDFLHLLMLKYQKALIGYIPISATAYQRMAIQFLLTARNLKIVLERLKADNVAIHKLWKHFNPGDQLPHGESKT